MNEEITIENVRNGYAQFGFNFYFKDWKAVDNFYKKMNMTLETKHIDNIAKIYYTIKTNGQTASIDDLIREIDGKQVKIT